MISLLDKAMLKVQREMVIFHTHKEFYRLE
jgi:hypothetical protein